MTVCAVKVFDDKIIMGTDGLLSNSFDIIDKNYKKIYRLYKATDNEMMYSIAGALSLTAAFHREFLSATGTEGQWLIDSKKNYLESLIEFVTVFIKDYKEELSDTVLHCLVAHKKHFCCHKIAQYSVREIQVNQYATIGSGDDLATGALHATGSVKAAIAAACEHNLHCGGTRQTVTMFRK